MTEHATTREYTSPGQERTDTQPPTQTETEDEDDRLTRLVHDLQAVDVDDLVVVHTENGTAEGRVSNIQASSQCSSTAATLKLYTGPRPQRRHYEVNAVYHRDGRDDPHRIRLHLVGRTKRGNRSSREIARDDEVQRLEVVGHVTYPREANRPGGDRR